MLTNIKVLSAALMLFATTLTAAAQAGPPTIDLQKLCRDRAKALGDLGLVGANAFDACMRSEQESRDAIVAAWKDIPSNYKATCIRPNDFSKSYAEWISCLELNMDVKKLRVKKPD